VVQGLAGGNIAQAVSGAAAPYLAEQIHNMTTTKGPDGKDVVNTQANLMAHAVVGAVTSWAAGNSALAGASGAVMGEYIAQQMYPGVDRKDLTEEQRQTISALGTLAAGLAGGVVGDSTADAVAGAQAGKNALENNNLILPAPVPVPGVPVGPGDQVKQDANKQIASGLDGALKDFGDAIDKATQCSFGRACSEDTGDSSANQPNIGKDLTDAEKAELGGSGSGTPGGWEPQDEENARNNASSNSTDKIGKWSVDELSDGAKHTDPASKKGDLTLAGRALQKHGSRPGSAFPSAKGNPSTINEQGQKIVDSILNDPNKTVIQSNTGRYGQVTDIFSSNGQGLRYDAQGKLIGFLEPPK
jgi:filamentous hemagglutinin